MAGITVTVKFDAKEMLRKMGNTKFMRAARNWGNKVSIRMEHEAKTRAPVDMGRLKGSITHLVIQTANNVIARIGSNVKYAAYQEFGTGIYGPRGRLIRPKSAKVLSWKPRGGARVFARFVRGVKPKKYFTRALKAVFPMAGPMLDEEMRREMETA